MRKFHICTQILQGNILFSEKIYTAWKYFTQPPVVTVATNFKSDSKVGEGFCSSSSFDNSRWNLKANICNAMHPHSNVGEGRRLQRKHGALSKERKMNFSLHTKKKVVKIFKDNKGAVVAYFCVDWYIFRPRLLPEGRSSEICGAFLLPTNCWRTAICLVGPTSGNLHSIFARLLPSQISASLCSHGLFRVCWPSCSCALLKIYFSDLLGIHLLFILVFPYVR